MDVILSARKVGPAGKAYGLDMTDEMLDLARRNAREAGVANAEFLKGEMEAMPLPDGSADVMISNCVVNLSPDKDAVFREAYRVLRPGGRIAIADIVVRGQMPRLLQRSLELWAGCLAGALQEDEYRSKLAAAGFGEIDIEVTREYTASDAEGAGLGGLLQRYGKRGEETLGFVSAMVRARKPVLSRSPERSEGAVEGPVNG
ncbi:MAG: methyltransferase domain-containing protein [Chloroflexi bacterium]|nr:methyltransferase domain-containing protein [Chloroflexota bacterium]